MNWNEIEKNYPKAFAEADIYGNVTLEHSPCIRNLYDFFDENGVYIGIDVDIFWDDDSNRDVAEYNLQISVIKNGKCCSCESMEWVNSRTEAESAAFEKAFEILETKLK